MRGPRAKTEVMVGMRSSECSERADYTSSRQTWLQLQASSQEIWSIPLSGIDEW